MGRAALPRARRSRAGRHPLARPRRAHSDREQSYPRRQRPRITLGSLRAFGENGEPQPEDPDDPEEQPDDPCDRRTYLRSSSSSADRRLRSHPARWAIEELLIAPNRSYKWAPADRGHRISICALSAPSYRAPWHPRKRHHGTCAGPTAEPECLAQRRRLRWRLAGRRRKPRGRQPVAQNGPTGASYLRHFRSPRGRGTCRSIGFSTMAAAKRRRKHNETRPSRRHRPGLRHSRRPAHPGQQHARALGI